jgi:ABC-type nitrate/sulfonate/bicarbonate transport system substrate-binding protein
VIPYQHAGLMTTRKYIAARPDIVRRVVKAIVEGAAVVRKDPETSKRALSIRMRIKDPKELEETYQQLRGFTQAKPYPSLEGFKAILNDLSKRMPAAKNADPKDFADLRFVEELDKSGYIDGLQ